MKFIKPFSGVPDGEIYPVDYKKGDECPKELQESAKALGCIASKPETEAERKAREAEEAEAEQARLKALEENKTE